tara:strand:+ start:2307 stop:4628 length:2322 start_codon:yes stop_codon:yes gene_type:complete
VNEFCFDQYWSELPPQYTVILDTLAEQLKPATRVNVNISEWGGKDFLYFVSEREKGQKERRLFDRTVADHTPSQIKAIKEVSSAGLGRDGTKIVFCYSAFIHKQAYDVNFDQFLLEFYNFTKSRKSHINLSAYDNVFKDIEKRCEDKTRKKLTMLKYSLGVLLITASILAGVILYDEHQTDSAINALISRSKVTTELKEGMKILENAGMTNDSILFVLSSLKTPHEMTRAEMTALFIEQAQSYVRAMNFDNDESISDDARDDIRVANKYLENGDFQAAKSFMEKSIESKTEEKTDIALRHEYTAAIQVLTNDYLAASKNYKNAADILLTSTEYNEKIGDLLYQSRFYLKKQAALYGDSSLQLEAINDLEWQFETFRNHMSDEEQILFTIELANSYSSLGSSTKNNDYIRYAESLLIKFAPACQVLGIKPNPQCYYIETALADILANRGTRTTVTQVGAQAHIDRMQKAKASSKSASYHSIAVSEKEQFTSLINELYISHSFFTFTSNNIEQENVLSRLKKAYDKSPEIFSDIRNAEEILSAYYILKLEGRRGRYAQESFYLTLIEARKKLIEQYSFSKNLMWAQQKIELAEMYSVLKNKTGDLKYLAQSIEQYEPSFQMYIDYAPSDLMKHQINFAIKLSNYGYAKKDIAILERAVSVAFAATENMPILGHLPDKRKAGKNLIIDVERLAEFSDKVCIKNFRRNLQAKQAFILKVLGRIDNPIRTKDDTLNDLETIEMLSAMVRLDYQGCFPHIQKSPSNHLLSEEDLIKVSN